MLYFFLFVYIIYFIMILLWFYYEDYGDGYQLSSGIIASISLNRGLVGKRNLLWLDIYLYYRIA